MKSITSQSSGDNRMILQSSGNEFGLTVGNLALITAVIL